MNSTASDNNLRLSNHGQEIEKKENAADRHPPLCLPPNFPARFLKLIDFTDTCWKWLGSTRARKYKHRRYRYGTYNGKYAHRMMYEAVRGPVPDGLELDHTCHNKLCVNPDHLEAVTHQVNCARRLKSGPHPDPNSIRSRRGYYTRRDAAKAILLKAMAAGASQ